MARPKEGKTIVMFRIDTGLKAEVQGELKRMTETFGLKLPMEVLVEQLLKQWLQSDHAIEVR